MRKEIKSCEPIGPSGVAGEYQSQVWCYIVTMSQQARLIPNEGTAPWDLRVPTTLRTPQNLSAMLLEAERKKSIYKQIALVRKAIPNSSAAQIKAASDQFQKAIAPLIEWAAKPRVRSELFMYRRSITGDKFSKLVSAPIEAQLESFLVILDFVTPNWSADTSQKRAQIMSIRGLALSCAPNFSRKGDIKSLSRSYSGLHISLVA